MNVLSLFSGIGGLELGLERAGMTVIGQVELDPYCRRVLAKHWPEVPRYDDVRTAVDWWLRCPECGHPGRLGRESRVWCHSLACCTTRLVPVRPPVDVICGGYPCQPFSGAGAQRGSADERWGWPWFADVIRAIRPRYVVVENVAALLRDADAFGRMLGDLAELGFDAEWDVLSACAFGAPHTRERLFLVAHAVGELRPTRLAEKQRRLGPTPLRQVSDGQHAWGRPALWVEAASASDRVADGTASRMVAAGGNAVVPQVAEHIGRLIVDAETAPREMEAAG
jgi:DNA (cytosine-5)-methyltransferase 1